MNYNIPVNSINLKVIGLYNKNANSINYAIVFKEYENNQYKNYKIPEMDCLKYDLLKIPIDDLEISEDDKCLLDSLDQNDVITFKATMKILSPMEELKRGRSLSHFKYVKIWNIKKYKKPKALEKLSNMGRYLLFDIHFLSLPTSKKEYFEMLFR